MEKLFFITMIFSLLIMIKSAEKEKCYVLALEGGADRGAYAAGAIKGLVENNPAEEIQWNVVTGISIGSLNAALLSVFEIGKEKEAADFIIKNWLELKKSDFIKDWWFGLTEGLLFRSSLFDNSHMKDSMKKKLMDKELKRDFITGAIDFQTGDYFTWDKKSLPEQDYLDAVISSASYLAALPPHLFRGKYYIDGGYRTTIDIVSGIHKCLENNFTEDNIVVDAILLSSDIDSSLDLKKISPLGVYLRSVDIVWYGLTIGNFQEAITYFPQVEFRYVVSTNKLGPGAGNKFDFNIEEIKRMIELGEEDAKNIVKKGSGVNLEEILFNYKEAKRKMWNAQKKNN